MMHWIISSSLRLRVLVIAFAAVLVGVGIWQLRGTPLDVVPEFSPPALQVKTEALGLSSAEVESLITVPLEADLLNGVPWLQSIESESITGLSSIEMFFVPGTDLMHARQMVQERLTQAHALPNVSSPPLLLQPVSTASRIMNIGLSSKTVSLIEMSVQAQWTIVPRLVGVPGVANVSVWGLRKRQLQVQVDPNRLHANKVTLEQVVKTAGEAVWASPLTFLNSSTPGTGGFIDTPNQRLGVRHLSPIATAGDFAKVPVFGTSLALGEIADVVEDHQPLIGDAIIKDGPGLMLVVEKFPGFNTLQVTRDVEAALAELRAGMSGIDVDTTIYRPASFIERASGNLSAASLIGCALAIVALGFLLGSWRAVLVGVAAMVVSLLSAGLVLHLQGVNFNMMVVTGLLLAIGVIVHDAILDTDTIMRRLRQPRKEGDDRTVSAVVIKAVLEARSAMLYGTLIAVLAVAPVLFIQGLSAAFFQPLIWAYIVAVLASMAAALTVTPALSMLLLPRSPVAGPSGSALMRWLQRGYDRVGETAVKTPVPAYLLIAVTALVGIFVWTRLERTMVPTFKETDVVIEWQGAPGTSLQAMDRITAGLLRDLRAVPGVRNAAALVGRALLSHEVADVNSAEVWVSIDPAADYDDTMEAVQAVVDAYPGVSGQVQTFLSKKLREGLTGTDEAISVRVYGHDLGIIRAKAEEIQQLLSHVEGVQDPRVEPQDEQATIEVEVDLDKARNHGLKPGDVRRAASALTAGITVGALFEEQKVFDVVVWGVPAIRDNLIAISNLMIDTETGTQVRLADVANVRTVAAASVIRRQGVARRIDVEAEVVGRPVSVVTGEVARLIQDVAFPFEYHALVRGEHVERRAVLNSLYGYFVTAAVMIFLLLQAALGSWRLAVLAVMGVPVVVLGGLLASYVGGGVFSLGSLLGFVTVLGLSVRNDIMLIRHFQHLARHEGEQGILLILHGVRECLPPIVATAITVGLLALPFVVFGDVAGLEIAYPAAVVILGGLVTSTLLALVLVPALYRRFGFAPATDALGLEEAEIA
jgi:Cu/Ag efflux pump CusA